MRVCSTLPIQRTLRALFRARSTTTAPSSVAVAPSAQHRRQCCAISSSHQHPGTPATLSEPAHLPSINRAAMTDSVANNTLPQALADDLALLQQHYDQLPFVLNPPVASALEGLTASPAQAAAAPAVFDAQVDAAEQLVTSAPSAKRRKQTPSSSAAAAVDAAATAALQLATPPPKPPRSRRSSRQAPAAAAADVASADLEQQRLQSTAAAVSAAAAAAIRGCRGGSSVSPPPPASAAAADTQTAADAVTTTTAPATAKRSRASKRKAAAAAVAEQDEVVLPVGGGAGVAGSSMMNPIVAAIATSTPAAAAATTTQVVDAVMTAGGSAEAGEGRDPVTAAAQRSRGRRQRSSSSHSTRSRSSRGNKHEAAAAAVQADSDAVTAADEADDSDDGMAPKATRGRGRRSTSSRGRGGRGRGRGKAAAAAAADADHAAVNGNSSEGTDTDPEVAEAAAEAAAAAAKPAKPVRRTKKVVAAEVFEAASQGQFDALTDLSSTYSHVALFNNNSNAAAWQALLAQSTTAGGGAQAGAHTPPPLDAPAAAAAAGGGAVVNDSEPPASNSSQQPPQQQQQPMCGGEDAAATNNAPGSLAVTPGRSGSLSLCRSSGLGSFRQQVWLHSSQSQKQPVFDAEQADAADADAAAAAAGALPAAPATTGCVGSQQQQPELVGSAGPSTRPGRRTTRRSTQQAQQQQEQQEEQATPPQQQEQQQSVSQQQQLKVLPNLGYACLCMTLRQYEIFNSRDVVKKTRDAPDGLHRVSALALQNARDLVPIIHWNEAHGIRVFRLSSNIFPWMTSYEFEDLPHWSDIQQALQAAGALAKRYGHRLTFHPSEYCKIAGERPDWVTQSVKELEVHSRIFDEMGFLPATVHNKINIHVGGTYGDKDTALERFSKVVNERLSPNCKARLTVENDDRASLYSVVDLMKVHEATGIPIVFDFHHWRFCTGDQTQEEAFRTALTTWPAGIRPLVHWSESPEDPKKMLKAHSEYVDGPINLYGLEGSVDVMIESKGKELALLEYREYILAGGGTPGCDRVGPRTARTAELAGAAAAVARAAAALKAEDGSEDDESVGGDGSSSSSGSEEDD